jgi:hypothetical protein
MDMFPTQGRLHTSKNIAYIIPCHAMVNFDNKFTETS